MILNSTQFNVTWKGQRFMVVVFPSGREWYRIEEIGGVHKLIDEALIERLNQELVSLCCTSATELIDPTYLEEHE